MSIKEYLDILKDLWTPTNASKIRMSISNALEMMGNNLKENIDRQDNVENQFQDVLDETTGKDVINGPEIIAARNGEANLKARLDKEKNEVTTQLAQTMTTTEFDSWVAALLDGGPSIFMDTLATLESTYPDGAAGVALVRETDPARIYVWNGTVWDDFGAYQGVEVKDRSITKEKVALDAIEERHIAFIDKPLNLFNGEYKQAYIIGTKETSGRYRTDLPGGKTAVIKVKPNTKYTIIKELSDRFRIAVTEKEPIDGTLDRYIKDEFTSDETTDKTYTVATRDNEHYLIITVSIDYKEPKLEVIEGLQPVRFSKGTQPVRFSKDIVAPNITLSNNLFDGNYVNGGLDGRIGGPKQLFSTGEGTDPRFEKALSAVMRLERNKNYIISKTQSDRFRVALSTGRPEEGNSVNLIRDEFHENGGDSGTEFTFNSEKYNFLIIYVSINDLPPEFLQVEEGTTVTEWETYGFKLTPQSEKYKSIGIKSGKVFVDDFSAEGKSDADTIQDAFDNSYGNIVVFNPERKYKINKTVTAHASKVRGIEGQNALIETDSDIDVLKYVGSKTSGNAKPGSSGNIDLAYTEMKPFIKNLRVSSTKGAYMGNGIVFDGTFGMTIDGCHLFNLKHGIKVIGWNRDFILSNNNIWHNSGYGVFWDNANVHQQILVGNHISYCKRALYLLNSDMHNLHITGNDIESGDSPASGSPESLIHFHLDADKNFYYEGIHIVGNSLQDHNDNTSPLLDFNSEKANGIQDLILGNNQLANSVEDSFRAKGLDRATLTGNSVKGNQSAQSINLVGRNRNIAISGNQLTKGVNWSEETTRTVISGNVANGFALPDSNDGKVLVANNI